MVKPSHGLLSIVWQEASLILKLVELFEPINCCKSFPTNPSIWVAEHEAGKHVAMFTGLAFKAGIPSRPPKGAEIKQYFPWTL